MNILYLEDRASISEPLNYKLVQEGHTVYRAHQIEDAMEYFKEEKIDFLIIDLRVIPTCFNAEQLNRSKMGQIAGWVFLEDFVFPKKPELKNRTIIYSEHIGALSSNVIKTYRDISFLSKSNYQIDDIIDCMNNKIKICRN